MTSLFQFLRRVVKRASLKLGNRMHGWSRKLIWWGL